MKCFYMHPGRLQNHVFNYCGCYFGSALWKEYKTASKKTKWRCICDMERVKVACPEEYEAALAKDPCLHEKDFGTCGMVYYPWRDGPAMLMEILIDNVWIPFVSEFLPEHILDRFKQAQAEWYEVLASDSAADIKEEIMQHAVKPSIQKLLTDTNLKVVGKFPLKEFYEAGGQAVSEQDWVRYFIEVASKADTPGLKLLEKVCLKYLENKGLQQPKQTPEMLPDTLSRGSRDFLDPCEL